MKAESATCESAGLRDVGVRRALPERRRVVETREVAQDETVLEDL